MEDMLIKMEKELGQVSPTVTRDLENQIRNLLDRCGLYYKLFSRIKTSSSMCEKIKNRFKDGVKNYKLQDFVGIRIVVYFKKDVMLCEKIINKNFSIDNISKDEEDEMSFRPQRINYVCHMPDSLLNNLDDKIWEYPIDKTFEIQIRTIFSEGWHEVEHDFRYKCEKEWVGNMDLSRTLNGVFATLENCDWAMENLLNQLAYRHYKRREWIPMLKNVFRMRIADEENLDDIITCFEKDNQVGKAFLRLERENFLVALSECSCKFPIRLSTLVYVANYLELKNQILYDITPDIIKQKCRKEFGDF